jgi:ribosomal protein L17
MGVRDLVKIGKLRSLVEDICTPAKERSAEFRRVCAELREDIDVLEKIYRKKMREEEGG